MADPVLKRILLVEDEPDIQTVARLALETVGGFTVEVCSSGDEALHKAPGFAPDLIMLDVMMPRMDGPTTFKALRAVPQLAATAVIFMTAKVQPREIEQYIGLGALGVISKPFDPMTLAATVRGIWTEHQILASSSGSLQERLDSLACAYREQLPEKIRQIDALWQPLAGGALDDSALKAIYVMAHNMCGSADTFRLPQLTEEARLLDRALQEVVEGKSQLTPKVRAHIGELVAALKAVVGKLTE